MENAIKTKTMMGENRKPTFICEICHCETPIECEGREPCTCAECMPMDEIVSNGSRTHENDFLD